jgi:hypothetical protein
MAKSRPLSFSLARILVLGVLVVGTTLPASPANAFKPAQVSFPVEISYEIPELSGLCGFEVWFHMEGTFKGTLFRNRSGTIVGEFDSQPNTFIWLYSPETGKSLKQNPFATRFHNRYPEGVDPGDRVITIATGYLEKVPGLPARAGRTVFPDGTVLFLDNGVPIDDYGEPSSDTPGIYKYDFDTADANVCAALAP